MVEALKKLEEKLRYELIEFARTFALDEVNLLNRKREIEWWGHDTNLGNCEEAFLKAISQILQAVGKSMAELYPEWANSKRAEKVNYHGMYYGLWLKSKLTSVGEERKDK